ncbi:MAG: hypothetical protein ACJAVZ_004001 [Afipia broomeae]|jgi:hypothetical protein
MMFGAIIVPVQTPPPAATTVTIDRATSLLGAERLPVIADAAVAQRQKRKDRKVCIALSNA